MHKRKPWKCSACGQEVEDLPMPVLQHQLSHVQRRPRAGIVERPARQDRPADRPDVEADRD